jgi:hypothetical protein
MKHAKIHLYLLTFMAAAAVLWLFVFKRSHDAAAISNEKTCFQTSRPWKASIDTRADIAIIYGVGGNPSDKGRGNMSFEERVESWRSKGYTAHFMTGIAWGEYQDYFTGEWDGMRHLDEGQVTQNGDTIWHGHMVPYIVPSMNFLKYLKEKHIKRVIDAGIDAIYMEEPEFWMRGGYSDAFKREWQDYYGFAWRAQHESPENTYLANKLKYHLYYRALQEVFTYAKEYGKSKGMQVRCYVPTHSLINYSAWQIVSPEASLASMPCIDGYIAQVWTGTSREPTFYNGIRKERVFENAFLEYGSMESMTRHTGRKMFFLTDPIEDWARDWSDYKRNYQATFAAQLLYPMVDNYEVMPWPERIYEGLYRRCATCEERERIPRFYSTQMQVMINALNDMPLSTNKISGSQGIAVLMANSMMFQRFPTHAGYDDPQLSNFYGQTLPLLKRGIPVEIAHIENVIYPAMWQDLKVLIMSYSNMKPLKAEYHEHIAQWVKHGGRLIYCGSDIDPYQSVMEWWNSEGMKYDAPSQHLFELLDIGKSPMAGEYVCGKGSVTIMRSEPKDYVMKANGDKDFIAALSKAYEQCGGKLTMSNNLYLERGPYVIAAVMDEGVSMTPLMLTGLYIDLFDPELPVLHSKQVNAGEQAFLYNISAMPDRSKCSVLCGAARADNVRSSDGTYSFTAKGPAQTSAAMRIYCPLKPLQAIIDGTPIVYDWDEPSHTMLIKFENNPDGVSVQITFSSQKQTT